MILGMEMESRSFACISAVSIRQNKPDKVSNLHILFAISSVLVNFLHVFITTSKKGG